MQERIVGATAGPPRASLDDILVELAAAHRVLAMEGLNFGTIGGVSLRDPAGRGYWTKRSGVGMEEVFSAAELVLTDFEGRRIAGGGGTQYEWPLRTEIFRARPDVNAVVYAPAFHAAVFSATGRPVLPVSGEGRHFDFDVPHFALWTGRFNDPAVCKQVAVTLGEAKAVLLQNNGLITVAGSVPVAVLRALFLERACEMQLAIETSRYEWDWLPEDAEGGDPGMMLSSPRQVDNFWGFYLRRLKQLESGCLPPGR